MRVGPPLFLSTLRSHVTKFHSHISRLDTSYTYYNMLYWHLSKSKSVYHMISNFSDFRYVVYSLFSLNIASLFWYLELLKYHFSILIMYAILDTYKLEHTSDSQLLKHGESFVFLYS